LKGIKDKAVLKRVQEVVEAVEAAVRPQDIAGLKKMSSSGNHFRIRVGDYRIGLTLEEEVVVFARCLHRRDLYRYFP
jgi:mRNA interferase RelE/StbE